ncbi:MAG TPA: hypothetical protein VFU97_12460 [Xanthobacteraceae bacterium]|jgi:hypothetical protein|nr:hypothetical protein [Xanthobacteraceae bacterium]
MRIRVFVMAAAALSAGFVCRLAAAPALDFEVFKAKVEPIFLEKRAGHTRCYVCHAESNNNFRLEKLSPGQSMWTEEQSRKNFETVAKLVNPGDPGTSRLLLHPLAPEGGGDAFHSGGRQFADTNDPDWKTIAGWVKDAK